MVENIQKESQERMKKSIESLKQEFHKIRTGRAHTSLLDHVKVPYYGSEMPLNQVANITVIDSRTLGITPWEKSMVPVVEKALLASDLGLTPATSGNLIRIPLPLMTEERRRDLIKVVRHEAENARVAIRNIRRDAIQQLKGLLKEDKPPAKGKGGKDKKGSGKEQKITEDSEHQAEQSVQKLTDKFIAEVDSLLTEKEAELMEI